MTETKKTRKPLEFYYRMVEISTNKIYSIAKNYIIRNQMTEIKMADNVVRDYTGIEPYYDIVKISANKVFNAARKSGARAVQPELKQELYQIGTIALLEAWNNYNTDKEASFKTYAYYRVKGSLIDYLRSQDTVSRSTRASLKLIYHDADTNTFSSDVLTDDQINLAVKRSTIVHQFGTITNYMSNTAPVIDVHLDIEDSTNKYAKIDIKETISKALKSCPLTDRELAIILQHYFEEKTLFQIGQNLDLTESRISQLHKEALSKMKEYVA